MRKIFEEYIESADYKITTFFKELRSQIETWFEKGSLAAQGCDLDGEIQISNYNPMEKFLLFNFIESVEDGEEFENDENIYYRYRVLFLVRIDQMAGEQDIQTQGSEDSQSETNSLDINKVLLKIHQFDDDNNEKAELVEEIDVTDIKEDFLIDKLSQLKGKAEDEDVDGNDLKDEIYTQ